MVRPQLFCLKAKKRITNSKVKYLALSCIETLNMCTRKSGNRQAFGVSGLRWGFDTAKKTSVMTKKAGPWLSINCHGKASKATRWSSEAYFNIFPLSVASAIDRVFCQVCQKGTCFNSVQHDHNRTALSKNKRQAMNIEKNWPESHEFDETWDSKSFWLRGWQDPTAKETHL